MMGLGTQEGLTQQGRIARMRNKPIGSKRNSTTPFAFIILLLGHSPLCLAAIYKCTAQDGSTIYGDTPCGPDAKSQQVTPAPRPSTAPVTATSNSLTPETIAAARDKSARETSALLCSTKAFNEWIKAQGHPLPDPNVRIAKLTEISNQCRHPLNLPDLVAPAPITAPKPILQGPAGESAAANLAELVKSGSIERLQKYLSLPGIDINDRPGTDEALLDYAADQNQAPVARFLIEHGAKVDALQTQGRSAGYTALHRAATVDAAEVAELLLAHGAEVNVHGPLGITPLILAASNGSRRTTEVLLNHGADVLVPTGHRETALSEATAHGHMDIVRLLLIHLPTPTNNTMNAAAMRGDLEALRLMMMHDELAHDVSSQSKDLALRFTILGPERFEERKQMIELLLAHGADVDNVQGGFEVIPVMLATTPELVEFLFAHGANKKANLSGAQLAQWFVCNDTGKDPVGMLQVVIAHGIDIGGTTPRGSSALPCAARANNAALLAFLTQHQVGLGRSNDNAPSVTPRPAIAAAKETQAGPNHVCVRFDQIDNSHTPVELYARVADCAHNNRDADAVGLFVLAGMDSSFDSLRVTDKTAGQARQILIMGLFESMPADVHARFLTAIKDMADQPQRHAALCEQVDKIGPPRYFPAYMVNHGMGAMVSARSKQAPPTPLEANFDAAATWADLLTSYLNCTPTVAPKALQTVTATAAPTAPTAPTADLAPTAGSLTTAAASPAEEEFPRVPEKHLPLLKAIPRQGEFLVEVGESFGRFSSSGMNFRSDVSIFELATHKEYHWDLPQVLLDGLAPQSSLHRASWAPQSSSLLFAKLNEAFLISKDGAIRALTLQMPGHLKPFDGIETYAMSPDGQSIAFYLYTRDVGDRQPDGYGKLYVDLMLEKTAGSPPVTIMRETRPSALTWSPDGQKIAYGTMDGQVVILSQSGKKLLSAQVGATPGPTGFGREMIWDLKWQPDGQQLGILIYPTRRLCLMDDKGTLKKIEFKSTGIFKQEVTVNSFAWSPDGHRVAFRSAFEAPENCNHRALSYKFETGNFPCLNGSYLYIGNSDGTGLTRITPTADYAYASQGELFWVQ